MPANEGFFNDQKTLHKVFLYSSLGLFAATIWMLAVDHNLSWKKYQLDFMTVKREKLSDDLVREQQKIDAAKLAAAKTQLQNAEADLAAKKGDLTTAERDLAAIVPKFERQTRELAFLKADQAQAGSFFDLDREIAAESASKKRGAKFTRRADADKKDLGKLTDEIVASTKRLEATTTELKAAEKRIAEIKSSVVAAEKTIKDANADATKIQRAIESTDYGAAQKFRALPIIDGFASPLRVKQTFHPDLQLDYNFAKVTRFDRCMTCHLGIDQKGFSPDETKQPYCSHSHMDLYVDSASKHPVEKFGCTVCHQGQGTATSFDWASHTPADKHQMGEWSKEHGWFFNHFHESPMLPKRFIESSCLKCHHDPYQIPQAQKLNAGFNAVRTNGCFGCHEINGFREDGTSYGPNLRIAAKTDTPFAKKHAMPKVGPNLSRVAEKLDATFVAKWIRNPQAFRPSSKMPQFYHQMDRPGGYYGEGAPEEFDLGIEDQPGKAHDHTHGLHDLANVEIVAMTEYLMSESKKYLKDKPALEAVNATGKAETGKGLFMTKGCAACHNHKDQASVKEKNFGPDLSQIGAKFTTDSQKGWLKSWIKNPAAYNPQTYMPNLQLSDQEIADIAAYLTGVPGSWATEVAVPAKDKLTKPGEGGAVKDPLRDLVLMNELKDKTRVDAAASVNKMSHQDQLIFLGKKTIGRLGCYACHSIPGFDDAKPIGVALDDWGKKDTHKLAFENVRELIGEEMKALPEGDSKDHFYAKNDYYLWAVDHHQREGFLMQKLREPRGYDYKKIRKWEDRARMPKFNLTDEDRESIATFVLGLVKEDVNPKYVYTPTVAKKAEIDGRNRLELYNCVSCHVIKPGEYRFTPDAELAAGILKKAKDSLDADYAEPFFAHHNAWGLGVDPKKRSQGPEIVIRGLPEGKGAAATGETPTNVVLWESTSFKGQAIPAGIKIEVPPPSRSDRQTASYGGSFAIALVEYYLNIPGADGKIPEPDASASDKQWNKVPPPLIREGEKVQTPWLYNFLRNPTIIRKSVGLRMPKFNYRDGDVEALANYFAAADGQPFPYIEMEEKGEPYLEQYDSKFKGAYLESGFKLVTNKELCIKCHEVGGYKTVGKPEEQGPSLIRAHERLRPDWMMRWIASPRRLVPYTPMMVNFDKNKPLTADILAASNMGQASNLEQIRAARDFLINYGKVVEQIMVRQTPQPSVPAPAGQKGN